MQLDLTDEESHLLREVLRTYLTELRGEIIDTDNSEFKRKLRHEREMLDAIAVRLDESPARDEPMLMRVVRVTAVWS